MEGMEAWRNGGWVADEENVQWVHNRSAYNCESAEVTLPCEPMKDEHQCGVSHTYVCIRRASVRMYILYVHAYYLPHSKHA